jgi:hypothetical protein
MSKQDRQGARTPANLEQKYNFGKVFSRLNAENTEQNLTMRQFAELMAENIINLQKDIQTLTKKDTEIEKSIEKSETSLDGKISAYWNTIYPVGSIYVSVSAISPAKLFGGTWSQIQDRFLLAAGSSYSAGSTGGEAKHKLTTSEMPSHNHNKSNGTAVALNGASGEVARSQVASGKDVYAFTASDIDSLSYGGNTATVGEGTAHNNMPPYLAVYVWKRTA